MNKYFIQLFLRENTVILPGFGALTAPNGNVEDIMFLPYLKTDDGKLADFIVETEGIDRQDAQNTIAKFIREMETNLSKGESFDIFQFGSFFKNETGEIEFKSWLKGEEKEAEKEVEPIITFEEPTNDKADSALDKIEEIEVEATEEIVVKPMTFDIPVIEKIVETVEEKIEEKAITPPKVEEKVEKKPIAAVVDPKPEVPKKQVETKTAPVAKPEKKEKKRKAPVWIFSVLLLGIIAFCTYWFWPSNKTESALQQVAQSETSDDENLKDTVPASTPEVVIPEQTPEPEPTAEAPIKQTSTTVQSTSSEVETLSKDAKGFFLIGGVYSSLTVAEKKVKAAKEEGLNAKLLPQGKSKMYISLADFTNRKEANEMLKTLRDKGKKVWILKK